jgi:hypothetical protein
VEVKVRNPQIDSPFPLRCRGGKGSFGVLYGKVLKNLNHSDLTARLCHYLYSYLYLVYKDATR